MARVRMILLIAGTCLLVACGVDAREAGPLQSRYLAIARGEVDVEGGLVPVFAGQSGQVVATSWHLGQRVTTGDTLATLDSRPLVTAHAVAHADFVVAQARRHAARQKRQAAEAWLARLVAAKAADAASPQAVEEARVVRDDQIALERIATAEANATAERLATASRSIDDLTVRAPVSGELVGVVARPWMRIVSDSETPMFMVLPDRPRVVHAQVDEEFAHVMQMGVRAEVVVGAAPEAVIPSKAVRCSSWLRRIAPLAHSDERIDTKVIDCDISVDAPTLPVGQWVVVRFLKGN